MKKNLSGGWPFGNSQVTAVTAVFMTLSVLMSQLKIWPEALGRVFAGIGFGYGRLFPLSWNSDLLFDWNEVDIIVEASTILRTVWEGTQFDLKAKVNIPLIRVFALSNSNKFLSLNFQEILHYFPDVSSTGTSTSVGLQFQFTAFGLSLSATFPNGNQNPAFMRYIDRDPVHSLTFFGEI